MVGGQEKRALSGLLMAFGWGISGLAGNQMLVMLHHAASIAVPKLQAETLKHLKLS